MRIALLAPWLTALALPLQAASVLDGPLWDDGKAEVAAYVAQEVRYRRTIDTQAILITVKEDLDAGTLVKADGPRPAGESVAVLKAMTVVEVPTGIYAYHQLVSAFLRRGDLRLVKLTVGSQEWCGNTYRAWKLVDGLLKLRGESYFDGEALVEAEVPAGVVFVDTLPVWLRGLDLTVPHERPLDLVGTQISNRIKAPSVEKATVRLLGRTARGLEVRVAAAGSEHVLTFDPSPPHVMTSWLRPDGSSLKLRRVERLAYWQMNGAEFQGYLGR